MAMSEKTKEKIDGLKKRVRTLGAQAAKGWKMTAVEAVGGGASYYALGALQDKVEFLQSHWYVTPGALILAGHFVKKKSPQIGAGLVFLGGFLGAQGYDQSSSEETSEGGSMDMRAGDAGAWGMLDGGEAGALQGQPIASNLTHLQIPMGAPMGAPAPAPQAGDMVYGGGEAYGLSD